METDLRRCPRDGKRLTTSHTERTHTCDHCGYVEQFGVWRDRPLVTQESARELVSLFRKMRAAGEELPERRALGIRREVA